MTPRRRALIIVGLILILIGIVIFAIMFVRSAVTPPPAQPVVAEPDLTEITEPPTALSDFVNPLIVMSEADAGGTAARQMAEIFAERYGSYSNQGDYENLRDLLPIMTARYRRETEAFLKRAEPVPGQAFEGVTSKKVSTQIRSIDSDSSIISVSLQQEKTSSQGAPQIGYRTLRMELQLVGTDWRVDASSWEN